MDKDILQIRLHKISKVFNISKILKLKPSSKDVKNYYLKNRFAYSFFHSKENFIHLGISKSNNFNKSDYLYQAKFISKYIKDNSNFNVLELATGRGANCKYLANKFKNASFIGVDISPAQLYYAKKICKSQKNFTIYERDFHNLNSFKKNSFDLVFVVESLCHSNNKKSVAKQVFNILKPGGHFVIIDGYLQKRVLTKVEQSAFNLTQKCMAINSKDTYKSIVNNFRDLGFILEYENNVSKKVIPSMRRLEKFAKLFFKYLFFAKTLKVVLPLEVTLNAITAYLWVPLTKKGVTVYYITVFKKP